MATATATLAKAQPAGNRRPRSPKFSFTAEMDAAIRQGDADEERIIKEYRVKETMGAKEQAETPADRHTKHQQMAYLLPILWDFVDAAYAVLENRDGGDNRDGFFDDAGGLRWYTMGLALLIQNETPRAIEEHIALLREKRCDAFARGEVACGCAVYWMSQAAFAVKQALSVVMTWRRSTQWVVSVQGEVARQLWLFRVGMSGIENSEARRMTPAARNVLP